jgi:TrmH family RNA methyltransferase
LLSSTNARLASARRLTSRKDRRETGRFLAEGGQAVREALRAGIVIELFATAEAMARNHDLVAGVEVAQISAKDAAALSETSTPQGLVAVCRQVDVPLATALSRAPRLVAALVEPGDPGNLGTIVRTSDAAGAGAVVLLGGVDVYNGKAVRASAGSLCHLDVVRLGADDTLGAVLPAARAAGLQVLATSAEGERDLDDLDELRDPGADSVLQRPTLWLFGNEAHGLPADVLAAADLSVRVPIHGRAESLNVAAAAAVCLYASARAQRLP